MFKKFPDTIATFPFLPAGASFGYLFFLPLIKPNEYNDVTFWPFFTMLFSIFATASVITIIKFNNGKYIFEHFSYLLFASSLYIIAGILFVVLDIENTKSSIFIVSIANGIVYVAGLSYVNIRAEKDKRPMSIGLCHVWKMIGFVLVPSLFQNFMVEGRTPQESLKIFNRVIGVMLIGTSLIFIFLLAVNEYRQRQGILYNYKDCLDHDNAIANNYCKLFSRNEVIVERNSAVSAAGLWKSTENLLPRSKKNYTNYWTIYCMLPKLHGAVLFHFLLIAMTIKSSDEYIDWTYSRGIGLWLMAAGTIVGCALLRFFSADKVYSITSSVAVLILAGVTTFYTWEYMSISAFLMAFYFVMSIPAAVPDLALMEIAKIRFSEGALALGFFFEIIPIAILQNRQKLAYASKIDFDNDTFLPLIITSIVILVVTSFVYQLHMPPTFNKSLLQIQNELLKFNNYFAFDFDEKVKATPRRSSDINQYIANNNNNVNVFETNETTSNPNDYTEVLDDKLPDPPVNRVQNYDYSKELVKPPAIIPRVKLAKF